METPSPNPSAGPRSWQDRIFGFLGALVVRRWIRFFLVSVLLTVIAGIYAARLRLDHNIMNLLPPDDPVVEDFLRMDALYGYSNKLLICIEPDEAMPETRVHAFMDHFARHLATQSDINSVDYKVARVQLNPDARSWAEAFSIIPAYIHTPAKDAFLMSVSPATKPGEIKRARDVMRRIKELEHEARLDVEGNVTGLRVRYSGSYAITLAEASSMESNIVMTSIVSLGLVLVLFFLAYNRFGLLFYMGITLVMAILWTLWCAWALFGTLNVLTISLAAILSGLGIEYGSHVCNRYLHRRYDGMSRHDAVREAVSATGVAILLSCVTTSLAFWSLCFTRFVGAAQFGLLVGIGVVLCMVSMIIPLPALLMFDGLVCRKYTGELPAQNLLIWLGRFIEKRAALIAFLFVVLCIGGGLFLGMGKPFPPFDNSLLNMGARGNKALVLQYELHKKFWDQIEPLAVMSCHKDPDVALRRLWDIIERTDTLVAQGLLRKQENVFQHLRTFLPKEGAKRQVRSVDKLVKKLKKNPAKQMEYQFLSQRREAINAFLNRTPVQAPLTYRELAALLPRPVYDRYFAHDETSGETFVLSYVYPTTRPEWDDDIKKLADAMQLESYQLRLSGFGVLQARLQGIMTEQCRTVSVWFSAVVLLVLLFFYRDLRMVLLALAPLAVAMAATFVVVLYCEIRLNYVSVMAFPLIVGIGLDNSIHVLRHYFATSPRSMAKVIGETGRAVLLTCAATMAGFGSLVLTNHNGLIDFALLTLTGVGFCLLGAFLLLPGLVRVLSPKR